MDFPQAGGHKLMTKISKNTVIKPTTASEVSFYIKANKELQTFLPTVYMSCPLSYVISMFSPSKLTKIIEKGYREVLIMENITSFQDEFILDIKLGKIHWTSQASANTINDHLERNKNSLTEKQQFRLDGAFIKNVLSLNKEDCRNFTLQQVSRVLSCLSIATKVQLSTWIDQLIDTLKKSKVGIYGPSILISGSNKSPRFTLIDFSVHDLEINNDLIEGLRSFQRFITDLLVLNSQR